MRERILTSRPPPRRSEGRRGFPRAGHGRFRPAMLALCLAVGALTAAVLLAGAGCENLTGQIVVRVNLSVSPEDPVAGAHVLLRFTNEGDVSVAPAGDTFLFDVETAASEDVVTLNDATGSGSLEPDESVTADWNQRDATGQLVPAGDYSVTVQYRAQGDLRSETRQFTILGPATP